MELIWFFGGALAATVFNFMRRVPSEDLRKPECRLCRGSGYANKFDEQARLGK